MKILFASSEIYPLIKTGGLADVAKNLPIALKNRRQAVRVIVPAYQSIFASTKDISNIAEFTVDNHRVGILETHLMPSRLKIWLIDCPQYFDRPGPPYTDEHGAEWDDNAQRYKLFCQAVARIATDTVGLKWRADVVHCNDWQTGLIPVYLGEIDALEKPKTVFTIHNLAFQGLFSYATFQALGLPDHYWNSEALEFFGQLSFIKGGLVYADQITTVSPNYAVEITTPEFGCGLEGVLLARRNKLRGVLNGIDTQEWNPKSDRQLLKNYSLSTIDRKHKNKQFLQRRFGLPVTGKVVLIGLVSRLYEQKGIDLILECLHQTLLLPIQFVVLGTGDSSIETQLLKAAELFPNTLAVAVTYDEQLAHQIIAGADVFAMPSRYEPCGLTQLYSLRYGTLPLVRKVGGLVDTVVNATPQNIANRIANGFVFKETSADALKLAIERIVNSYKNKALWRQLQTTAMKKDFSWASSANSYLELYRSLVTEN